MNNKIFYTLFLVASISANIDKPSIPNILGDVEVNFLFEEYPIFESRYKSYEVEVRSNLASIVDISVVIMFGTWCHDSKREVPRMLRILNEAGVGLEQISLIGVDFNKEEPMGREKFYNLKNTPTFIFLKNGYEIGRIIERPKVSLESDLINLMTKSSEPVVEG